MKLRIRLGAEKELWSQRMNRGNRPTTSFVQQTPITQLATLPSGLHVQMLHPLAVFSPGLHGPAMTPGKFSSGIKSYLVRNKNVC